MSNPNMLNAASITGKQVISTVNTTATAIVTNSSDSNALYKVSTLTFTNISASTATATVSISKNGTEIKMANTLSVPTNTELVIISKDTAIYLEENDILKVYASANTALTAACTYEIIT